VSTETNAHFFAEHPLMTLRVSRDSGQTWGSEQAVFAADDLPPLMTNQWPPCQCRRCTESAGIATAEAGLIPTNSRPTGRRRSATTAIRPVEQEGTAMLNGTDLYALDIDGAAFVKACGGPCTEGCVTLARIGDDAWALGDSKRPDAQPLRFTTEELDAAGIDPARFGLTV
jgi:hypothetical protein